MRRHIPGLHSGQQDLVSNLEGSSWFGSKELLIVGIPETLSRTPILHSGAKVS